jgi:hypothetical protein
VACELKDVRFDVWPRGVAKSNDGFFCASAPSQGKPDDCGRYSSDLYDDDMSAPWTEDYPGNGYNLCADGSAQSGNCASYKSGNQHLYRIWPIDSDGYALRGSIAPGNLKLDNLSGTETSSTPLTLTNYTGDYWVTSGFKPGRSHLNVTIAGTAAAAGHASGTLPIFTYFCNNPWPDARNFPFVDSDVNCKTAAGCYNTIFGTYYCRDAGLE